MAAERANRNPHAPGVSRRSLSGSPRPWRGEDAPLERLLAAFDDLVVVRDLDGRIIEASASFAEVTGCADPAGRAFLDFCAVPEGDALAEDPHIVVLETKDGRRYYDWREVVTRDPQSGAAVVHSLGRDVTASRRAGQEAADGRERAEQASAAKSRFLAMVSHEVRTPLNGILGITQLLGKTRLTREQESYVEAVRHSGHALMALIEDLLDFSSMEAGRFYLRPGPTDLHALVTGVVELSAARADEKGIEIAAHVAADVPASVVADEGRLRQVLFNLIGNGLKFTEVGGVLVEVGCVGSELEFRVTDSGPGIAATDRERIFREFEQVDAGPMRRKGGAGLGLAISARLATAMGGSIGIDEAQGAGTTFMLRIPMETDGELRPEPAPEPRLAASRVLLVCPAGPTATALRRLIVEEGGRAEAIDSVEALDAALLRLGGQAVLTDVIVDNRIAAVAETVFAALDPVVAGWIGRTMMVMPAERDALTRARARDHSAWLIRPLRAASVIKVLRREIGGIGAWLEERRPQPGDSRNARSAAPAGKSLRILLAEDNPVNALLVRSALQRVGHIVTHVTNGRDLVEKVCGRVSESIGFDLVLTDLSMPEMDGTAAIAAIREFEKAQSFPRLPIIVLSADGQVATREKALQTGADDYVEKPVDPDTLLQTAERTAIPSGRQAPSR